ncbi:hypothetical protein [uncultured Tissierella sp.]|uniref:phosphotriesterase family protein n=1 Tax=Tissierella sp. TaxID=41274 RepID=UPI0028057785|nr:hypothetical protein [uncultured Tissierella sp.]MDU5082638.1 hypothetical protein [Bacillota bacterium]
MKNIKSKGYILVHEHLFNLYPYSKTEENTKYALKLLDKVSKYNIDYIVDLTPYASLNKYLDIIDNSPVEIICCIGFYCGRQVKASDKRKTVEELYQSLRNKYIKGISNRKIKPGIIKIATNSRNQLKDYECRFINAAIKLSNEFNLPIAFHCPNNTYDHFCELLKMGVNPRLLMICHYEKQYNKLSSEQFISEALTIANSGSFLQINDFGTVPKSKKTKAIMKFVESLIIEGYTKNILLSSDCNWKWKNGSPCLNQGNLNLGYNYLFEYTIPLLQSIGISARDITNILENNPRRLLNIIS